MAKYTGGSTVKGGYYWNPRSWKVEVIPSEGGRLPAEGAKYVRVPFPALFVMVPLLGALFLVFLPFIGFALFAHALVKKVTGGVKEGATDLAATMSPGWRPGEAHLAGKPGEEKAGEGKPSAAVEKLEKEIAEKRGEKK
ncbi:hypothetical protein [Anaeromyxobacter oryzisoli]|uniref:hypothetical protein n=1 Tax=Anaeromyxobacter oryzisoli TaxID=2925408 RepID=UPI001F5778E5|nr:hypothetical protein [Anaeromyxobacter sp. SG63]